MKLSYDDFDLSGIRTYPLASRPSKVRVEDFAKPVPKGANATTWLDTMPNLLAASDLRAVIDAFIRARGLGAPLIWGIGAHVLKVGLGPVLVDLMERGWISGLATNGAGLIHDFEIALSGATSEDVETSLSTGAFGMAEETGRELNEVLCAGVRDGLGLGQALSAWLLARRPPFAAASVLTQAARLEVPVTAHVALGTDIIHMHPSVSGAALGEGSLRDFRYFTSLVCQLKDGVYVNCGSAVILPEVFLKAVALARNRGVDLTGLTTINLDFIRQYRAQTNVVQRPVQNIGRGYSLVGHHELMIPLIAALLVNAD